MASLSKDGRITVGDLAALASLCRALARLDAVEAELDQAAPFYATEAGLVKAHPGFQVRAELDRSVRAWIAQFGLTPNQRETAARAADAADLPTLAEWPDWYRESSEPYRLRLLDYYGPARIMAARAPLPPPEIARAKAQARGLDIDDG